MADESHVLRWDGCRQTETVLEGDHTPGLASNSYLVTIKAISTDRGTDYIAKEGTWETNHPPD